MLPTKWLLILVTPCALAISGCMNSGEDTDSIPIVSEEEKGPKTTGESDKTVKERVKFDKAIINNIPSSVVLLSKLKQGGAVYHDNWLHHPEVADSYTTKAERALNLGVYGADLAYACEYGQNQGVIDYLGISKVLAEKLGLGKYFDVQTFQRFEDNLHNPDSLELFVHDIYDQMDEYLRTHQRISVATLILTGGWAESMYLTTSSALDQDDADQQALIFTGIWEQQVALANLLDLCHEFEDARAFKPLLPLLQEIAQIYEQVESANAFEENHVRQITDKVVELRGRIVQPHS